MHYLSDQTYLLTKLNGDMCSLSIEHSQKSKFFSGSELDKMEDIFYFAKSISIRNNSAQGKIHLGDILNTATTQVGIN